MCACVCFGRPATVAPPAAVCSFSSGPAGTSPLRLPCCQAPAEFRIQDSRSKAVSSKPQKSLILQASQAQCPNRSTLKMMSLPLHSCGLTIGDYVVNVIHMKALLGFQQSRSKFHEIQMHVRGMLAVLQTHNAHVGRLHLGAVLLLASSP